MANQIFRSAPVYVDGKKIAECSGSTYDHMNNSENMYGIDGVLGQTDGISETKVEITSIQPVAGMQKDLGAVMRNNTRVTIAIPIGGKLEQMDGKIIGRTYTSDSKSGKLDGKFSFIGGDPTVA